MSAKGRGPRARVDNHYMTPDWATRAILRFLHDLNDEVILDLGCGVGAIAAEILRTYPKARMLGIELDPKLARLAKERVAFEEILVGDIKHLDATTFGATRERNRPSFAIFNPEFSLATDFVDAALRTVAGSSSKGWAVCCLQRLNWLGGGGSPKALKESIRRHRWHLEHPADVKVLSRRPGFLGKGKKSENGSTTDATEYAWFCWGNHFTPGHLEIVPAEQLRDLPPKKTRGGLRAA